MRTRLLTLVAGLALAGGLTAAPATAAPPAAAPSQVGAAQVGAAAPATFLTDLLGGDSVGGYENYVALGDSYTAGPLVPAQTLGPLGCFRSTANYPAFLAAYLRVKTFTDVSCSAARSEHLFESQVGNLPDGLPENFNAPQLLAVTPETDLVTLGIGGNDFSLFGQMIDQCADLAKARPEAKTPCKDHFTEKGVDTKIRDAKKIQKNIEKAIAGIKKRAPKAKVVVVNYLHILPQQGTCRDVPFAAGDYAWGTKVHQQLNTSLKNAAKKYKATYVDMYAASVGHDACAGVRDAWVNGATIKPRAMNFHPYRSGMKAIADTTYWTLVGQPSPTAAPALQLVKRLPAVIDVKGLLTYVASGGKVPPQTLEQAEAEEGSGGAGPIPGIEIPDPDSITLDGIGQAAGTAVLDGVLEVLRALDSVLAMLRPAQA